MLKFDATKGGWIGYSDWVLDARPFLFHPIAFRKNFKLALSPKKAELIITAGDKFVLYINGSFIDQGPARSYAAHKLYDCYDILSFLIKGENKIAVLIFPSNATNISGTYERMGLLVQTRIDLGAGRKVEIFTDENWKTRMADWINVDYKMISLPIGQQLHVDASKEPRSWQTGKLDKHWKDANLLGPINIPPWLSLEERPVPRPVETSITPKLIWKGKGSTSIIENKENLAPLFNKEAVKGRVVESSSSGVKYSGKKENIWCFDFGKTRFIRPSLKISKVKGSVRIELYYDMKFTGRPTVFTGFGSKIEGSYDTCVLNNTGYDFELSLPRGFRFMTVKTTGKGSLNFELKCRSIDYPFKSNAKFEAKDNFWQSVWNIATENLKSSTTDVAVDCCSRENLLWSQDAAVSTKAAYHSFGETAMWRHSLNLLAQGVAADGRPSAIVPSDIPSSLYCQQMHWVMSIWEYYMATGDRDFLKTVGPAVERYIKECSKRITKEDFFIPPGHSWHWVDWAPVDRRAYSLPINALLVMACKAAGKIAVETGNKRLSELSCSMAVRVKNALQKFFDYKKNAFRSHIEPKIKLKLETERLTSRSSELDKSITHNVHSNLLTPGIGAGTEEMRKAALHYSAQCFMQQPGPHNQISYPNLIVLIAPLIKAGYMEAVFRVIDIMYRGYIDLKCPTFNSQGWGKVEEFNTAHGWAATINTLIVEHLIGLKPLKPGWKVIGLDPVSAFRIDFKYALNIPGGVVSVVHENGRYKVSWPKGRMLVFRGRKIKGNGKVVEL